MMDILIAILLGIVEGITEFLPISSSAHIRMIAQLCKVTEVEQQLYAIVIQMGAGIAMLWHFRYELFGLIFPRVAPQYSFTGIHGIIVYSIATLPAIILGLALKPLLSYIFAPWTSALFLFLGALFIIAIEYTFSQRRPTVSHLNEITYRKAFYVGLFQCLSLFSGFSRSTATIMGALSLGFSRPLAVQFSFLLAIPLLCGATLLKSISMWSVLQTYTNNLLISSFVAFCISLLSIRYLLALLSRISFIPFAIYRIIISVILLAILL